MYGSLVLNPKLNIKKLEFKPYYLNLYLMEADDKTVVDFKEKTVNISMLIKPSFSLLSDEIIYPFGTCTSFNFENKEVIINILTNSNKQSFKEIITKNKDGLLIISFTKFKFLEESRINISFKF